MLTYTPLVVGATMVRAARLLMDFGGELTKGKRDIEERKQDQNWVCTRR